MGNNENFYQTGIREGKRQEVQDVICCLESARTVKPKWRIADTIELLRFREEVRAGNRK